MKNDKTSIGRRTNHRTYFDAAEELVGRPTGGRIKQWLAGVLLAATPIVYGVICLHRGHTTFFGRGSINLDLRGAAGFWMAVAYIALGSFLHFHYFWALSDRLWRWGQVGKFLSALVFLPSFLYSLYRYFV